LGLQPEHTSQYPAFLTTGIHQRRFFISLISRKCLMTPFIQQSKRTYSLLKQANGFILLEILVAMGLVTGSWMVLGGVYQQMVLRLGQLQEQRMQMKQELNQHELALLTAAQSKNLSHQSRKLLHESSGMPRRSRPISIVNGTSHKK